jgi:Right handed beta helix region
VLALSVGLWAPSAASATTFYVNPSGADGAPGTSTATAWASIARVNAQHLRPGDAVLFKGGATYRGNVSLGVDDSGRSGAPVTIGSYGSSRATVAGGNSPALSADGTQRLIVRDLNLVGSGAAANSSDGLLVYNESGHLLGPISVRRVSVSGWGDAGVSVGGWGRGSGYDGVVLDHVDAHDNGNVGIVVWAQQANMDRNVDIGWSRAWENRGRPGVPTGRSSGNGIVLGSTNGGRIHDSVAFHNGGLDNNPVQGPAGIWTYDSNAVRIDHNESYGNRTGSKVDGDGFDLDVNVTNTVLENNSTYGNDGPGILWANAPNRSNTPGDLIRRNVSRDDSRRLPLASILLWRRTAGLQVEHNTVIARRAAALGFLEPARSAHEALIVSNLLVATSSQPLVRTIGSTRSPSARLEGNVYVASRSWRIEWAGRSYGSLAGWRTATGQERMTPLRTR